MDSSNLIDKFVASFVSLLLLFQNSLPAFTQTNMFRGTPDHTSFVKTNSDVVFGEQAWNFYANGPIRSTVVYSGDAIFFGCSNGKFYALDKENGRKKWEFYSGYAINSSPALHDSKIFFSDNKQTLYSLNATTGKLIWKVDFGVNRSYEWAFDYFYSSPTLVGDKIVIGIKDGYVYCIDAANGKEYWKYKTSGIVRSTAASKDGVVYFGDTDGVLYALTLDKGKEIWKFLITGNSLKNEDFGFDRRAIISSPVVVDEKILVGGRDGFLYAVNKNTGKLIWNVDHNVSWVISSVAVRDSIVVAGTSDGRFVQAVNLNTGKEIWKYRTISIVWSSPVIHNSKVYVGSQEGVLYCLDLKTGKKVHGFQTSHRIFTSPVISDTLLYFGNDNGYLYALKPNHNSSYSSPPIKKFVYWEPGINIYFRFGTDMKIKDYLASYGYSVMDGKKLQAWMRAKDSAVNSVIVFASNFFTKEITDGYEKSLLRNYLNNGGKIVVLGIMPLIYKTDSAKNITGRNFLLPDSVLNINYGPDDLRAFKGFQPGFPTAEGEKWGIKTFWVAPLSLPAEAVDIILGKDENGLASAWVKKYHSLPGSGFVQIWVDADGADDLSYILRVAEYGL